MTKFAGIFVAAALAAGATQAAPVTFNIVLDTDTVDGSGTIVIDDSLIGPNASVLTSLTTVSIDFAGYNFSNPFSPTTEAWVFDAAGYDIAAVEDTGGSFVDFGDTLTNSFYVELNEGANPGTFKTFQLPGGELSGRFSITREETGVVPLPAGMPLLLGALALTGFAARRRKG